MSCVVMEGKLWMKNPVMSGSQEDRGYMALNSVRQDSKVVHDKGVYVEMEGIMKVSCTAVKTLTTRTSQNTFSPPRAR